jgi:hypothetical protein
MTHALEPARRKIGPPLTFNSMGHGLSNEQVDAIYRAGVIADKHSEALKRLMQDGAELSDEVADVARGSAESAGRFYEVAEKWKRRVEVDAEGE